MTRLSPLLSRLLALALLIGCLAAGYLLIAEPLRQRHAALDETIGLAEELLQRFAQESGDAATLTRQRDALAAQSRTVTGGLLRGDNETLAGAFVQSFLTSAVEGAGGSVRSVQVLPVRAELGLRKVAARVQLQVTSSGLRDLLHRIEGADPYLFVDNLDLRQNQPPDKDAESKELPLLVRFEIYGYLAAKPVAEEPS